MTLEQIKEIVSEHFTQHNVLISTERIESRLSQAIYNFIERGDMPDTKEAIIEKLNSDRTVDFLKERQPNIEPVSAEVVEAVKRYFENSDMSYMKPIKISRASNHPEDNYLYFVTAVNERDMSYACWTSWNQNREVLNYGHYRLDSLDDVKDILTERFNDITDELDKYGPACTEVEINTVENLNRSNQKDNVIPYVTRKGR